MKNEMGNNNTSEIIKEEDKALDEVVKTETSEVGLSFSSDDTKPLDESTKSTEKVKEDTELEPEPVREPDSQFPQILTELCNPACVDSEFSIAESTNEGINEKVVELNLKESELQINSQVIISEGKEDIMPEPELDSQFPPELCNPACVDSDFSIAGFAASKEMNTGEVGDSGGNKPANTTSQIHGTANDPDKIHEKFQSLPLIQPPDSGIKSVGDEIHLEENDEDFVQEQSDPLEEKVLEMDTISKENEDSEFLAYVESENEADSIKKTEIYRKIEDLTVSVKEIDKQSIFRDLDKVFDNIEEVRAISLTITTTGNEKLPPEMIDHTTLRTAAETETLSKQSNEENAISETSPLPNCDDQELIEEVAIRSNGQKKSPSFDFDIPLVILKSEESDQTTPLLHHDKSASRSSFSGYNNILQNERGVIRMERSDSVVSRSSLIKRDEDMNVEYVQERKESHFSDDKAIELPVVEELALTKQKGRGNHKPKSPLFSTCICCTANFD